EIKQTNQTYRPYSQATSVLCTLDTCLSYLGPSQAPNLGTETNLKLSTYTGHIANTYIHTQGTTQGTKTRHNDKAHRQGTQNQAHKTRQTVSTHLDPKHFSSHQGSVLPSCLNQSSLVLFHASLKMSLSANPSLMPMRHLLK